MSQVTATHIPSLEPIFQSERGKICRCRLCGGLHWQFGNLSAKLTAESFLRLANMVEYAATHLASKLIGDEHVVIPFTEGNCSLLLDRADLADLHTLVRNGLKCLDEPQEEVELTVH